MLGSEKDRTVAILKDLNLPEEQYVLAGSGVMILKDIQRHKPMGDVDIFCATRLWMDLYDGVFKGKGETPVDWEVFTTDPKDWKRRCDPPYLKAVMHGFEVNIFSGWRTRGIGDIDVNFWILNAEEVEGWPCVPVRLLFDWKRAVGRAKDVDDIRILAEYLDKGEA